MKLAFLIQCHKSPAQVNKLLSRLDHPNVVFFVHVDKKSNMQDKLIIKDNIHLLPDELREDVRWGEFSQVQASINLLQYAKQFDEFDYYWQISGQDYPIHSIDYILHFLTNNNGNNFLNLCNSKFTGLQTSNHFDKRAEIYYPHWMSNKAFIIRLLRRIYVEITGGQSNTFRIFRRKKFDVLRPCFGSCWWCLNNSFVSFALEFIENRPQDVVFFKNVICSDESFFQTIFMSSPYVNSRKDYLHYIDWSALSSSPKNLTKFDFNSIISSKKLIARKIDCDFELMSLIDKYIDG